MGDAVTFIDFLKISNYSLRVLLEMCIKNCDSALFKVCEMLSFHGSPYLLFIYFLHSLEFKKQLKDSGWKENGLINLSRISH